jgi:tRNA U38,U39,U40 pseudouridine synthase TruA
MGIIMHAGVHAARIVISAKLLLAPEWLYPDGMMPHKARRLTTDDSYIEEAQRFPAMVTQLNDLLPPAIRAFSCVRVNKGFQAREACHWRYSRRLSAERGRKGGS